MGARDRLLCLMVKAVCCMVVGKPSMVGRDVKAGLVAGM